MDRRERGFHAERAAASYLRDQGLIIREANFSCRAGEIDLIAIDGDCLVFVEVRARRRGALVDGAESISARKKLRLIRAARFFLHRHGLNDCFCRFDVIAVSLESNSQEHFQWIRNAFDATT
ncbi:putative endonuclease [Halospina denitrificans]|uniref:UPF0102 protein DES49_2855 n=1 Tax=Halospina denitrificans TaxID=332522 RepID=A0A4R7JJ03_9GAMM|nr:YraN family protein [Halospina denitrificans]TDT37891.1 putative endonuclease [Halospina denitrificans]